MKKVLRFILLVLIFVTFDVKALELDIKANNALLYNLDSGEVLYEKESESRVQIASLTKIMTAVVTLDEVQDLDKQVIITYDDLKGLNELNLVTAGFTAYEAVTYRDLLYGLLLPSGADAAMALSRNISGSEEEFIKLMNEKVKELGLKNTNFAGVIGLDDENNYSTAKDISKLFKKALDINDFKTIITSKEYTTSDGKLTFKSTIQNNAKRYNIDVPYILGGKTGTTDGAGLCLASIANANEVNYLLVTLGSPYDKKGPHHIEDAKVIYDYFIDNFSNKKIVDKKVKYKSLKTKYLEEDKIDLYPNEDIIKYVPNDYKEDDIKYEYEGIDEVSIFSPKKLGMLKIYYKDELLKKEDVILKVKTHFSLIKFLKGNIVWFISGFVLVFVIIFILKRKK